MLSRSITKISGFGTAPSTPAWPNPTMKTMDPETDAPQGPIPGGDPRLTGLLPPKDEQAR